MVKHRSTSGLMLLVIRKIKLIFGTTHCTVHVLTTDIMVLFHYLLEMTTIVIVQFRMIQKLVNSTLYDCGLVEDVLLQVSAAPIVECHGFVRLYIPVPTTDYSNCHNTPFNEDTALELIELYIH